MKQIIIYLILILIVSCSSDPIRVGIQPYDNFDSKLVDSVYKSLKESYDFDFVILPKRAIPKRAFVNIKSPRYRADSLLLDLRRNINDSLDYILGLTNRDISTTKRNRDGEIKEPKFKYSDWGIFGLGYRPGPTCVVSIYRLKNNNSSLFMSRLKKVCTHELGHNLGLKHCPNYKCVMMDAAETIKTIDLVNFELCNDCLEEIK